MDIGLVGDGPAVDAVDAALGDVDVNVMPVAADLLDGFDFAVVVDTAGADAFARANAALDRWVAVEVGGVGAAPVAGVDAAVTVFEDACYDCLRQRIAAGAPETEERPAGVRSAVRYAGAVAGRRTIQALSGETVGDTVVEVPGAERRFLSVPFCDCGSAPGKALPREHRDVSVDDALERAERAVDGRVGILSEVGERESFPVPYYIGRVADTTGFSDARAAEFAAGVDRDWDAAFMKAIGEGLERYAAGVYRSDDFAEGPPGVVENPVPPARFVTPDDRETVGAEDDDSLAWVSGEDLATGENAALPAEFVQFPPHERRFRPSITTGLGLGNSGVEAVLSGLYETIERDATMIAWYSTLDPLELRIEGDEDPAFAELRARANAVDLSVTPLLVTADVDVPVVAVGVHREGDWPRFAAGSAADLDPYAAARSALSEALQNWMELRAMGPDAAAEQGAAIGDHADYPAETRAFFDPDAAVPAEDLGVPNAAGAAELDAVLDRLADADLDAYAARTTTRDVAALGFEAVRALVPAAQPLFTGEPFFGERAREVPESMGFEPRLDAPYHPFP
ncbi:YcaO-like family protein [Haloparvum sedimenti]|uniref:YcaO-like family protein n=1 Tax=Haloparvum sedimenti TaxID=1678448 RepID=UPI00071E7D56|nr:YcaO-like family protein [Haloparvum sedimenti]